MCWRHGGDGPVCEIRQRALRVCQSVARQCVRATFTMDDHYSEHLVYRSAVTQRLYTALHQGWHTGDAKPKHQTGAIPLTATKSEGSSSQRSPRSH